MQQTDSPVQVIDLTESELQAALRFCETCEDGEGYDVPKPMMKQLACKGLVRNAHFGRYEGTRLLDQLQEESHTGIWNLFRIDECGAVESFQQEIPC